MAWNFLLISKEFPKEINRLCTKKYFCKCNTDSHSNKISRKNVNYDMTNSLVNFTRHQFHHVQIVIVIFETVQAYILVLTQEILCEPIVVGTREGGINSSETLYVFLKYCTVLYSLQNKFFSHISCVVSVIVAFIV